MLKMEESLAEKTAFFESLRTPADSDDEEEDEMTEEEELHRLKCKGFALSFVLSCCRLLRCSIYIHCLSHVELLAWQSGGDTRACSCWL